MRVQWMESMLEFYSAHTVTRRGVAALQWFEVSAPLKMRHVLLWALNSVVESKECSARRRRDRDLKIRMMVELGSHLVVLYSNSRNLD
jgi:hypothetical protein